ncbi:MAG: MBL fold metallo-hydrolase [Proteobacteria bacterium]|jgi:hypothetical protein|nr:MBL fold metallo-hydrolase [Pseudomonadota bacterium]
MWFFWLVACAVASPDPWSEGELLIEQIDLPGSFIGESALVVGPDGTSVLIDVGNDSHIKEVLEAVDRHLPSREVDYVVLTHYHDDHIGGFDKLFNPHSRNDDEPLEVREKVVWRGSFDLGGANRNGVGELCDWFAENPTKEAILCGGKYVSCELDQANAPWPADHCDGLLTDEGPFGFALGDGATLEIFAANAWTVGPERLEHQAVANNTDTGENARSTVGVITYGDFEYLFGGDLTGGRKGTPNIEAFVAEKSSWAGHPVPAHGVDVVQLNHHGLITGTSAEWVDWLLPSGDSSRNAVVGSNWWYGSSPAPEVRQLLEPRLGNGAIWITRKGLLSAGKDPIAVARGPVVIRVGNRGQDYSISNDEEARTFETDI